MIEQMDQIFRRVDTDDSGFLDINEVERLFAEFGMNLPQEKMNAILRNMNVVRDGHGPVRISRNDFLAWLMQKEEQAKNMPLEEFSERCFEMFSAMLDINNNKNEHGHPY